MILSLGIHFGLGLAPPSLRTQHSGHQSVDTLGVELKVTKELGREGSRDTCDVSLSVSTSHGKPCMFEPQVAHQART